MELFHHPETVHAAQELRHDMARLGPDVLKVVCDVSDQKLSQKLSDTYAALLGALDALIQFSQRDGKPFWE
jgi:hypothetical protein